MTYQTLVRECAAELVGDYRKNGIDAIIKIYGHGSAVTTKLERDTVSLAARYLQSDEIFADWAFIFIMTRN